MEKCRLTNSVKNKEQTEVSTHTIFFQMPKVHLTFIEKDVENDEISEKIKLKDHIDVYLYQNVESLLRLTAPKCEAD